MILTTKSGTIWEKRQSLASMSYAATSGKKAGYIEAEET